jgi:predicted 3-demethylubiquinone-9 3-methyltransferase (glyoxalase superfamily)
MFVANGIFNKDEKTTTPSTRSVTSSSVEEAAEPQPTTESISIGKANALKAAQGYLDIMPFSAKKLVEQLEFNGYSHDDAVYGASNCGADWNQQAAAAAKNYLNLMPFSKEKLIEQLVFDGYTQEQAEYGVSTVDY